VEGECGAGIFWCKTMRRILTNLNICGERESEHRTTANRTFAATPQKNETLTLQLQHARFLAENRLCGVAQLVDLFRGEQERTVLGRLPGPRVEEFAEDELRVFECCGHCERLKMRRMRYL